MAIRYEIDVPIPTPAGIQVPPLNLELTRNELDVEFGAAESLSNCACRTPRRDSTNTKSLCDSLSTLAKSQTRTNGSIAGGTKPPDHDSATAMFWPFGITLQRERPPQFCRQNPSHCYFSNLIHIGLAHASFLSACSIRT